MFNASLLCVMTVWAFSSSTAPVFFVEHPHYDHGIVEDSDPLQSDFVFFPMKAGVCCKSAI